MLNRPKLILKYAKSQDGFLGQRNKSIWLTNDYSKRLVHKWRSEVSGILVGTGTVIIDNPKLNSRYGFKPNPIIIILDSQLKLGADLFVFNNKANSIVITKQKGIKRKIKGIEYLYLENWELKEMMRLLYFKGIESLIIEGGQKILNSFVEKKLWDEARVFTSKNELITGLEAPNLNCRPIKEYQILTDKLEIFHNQNAFR